MTSEFQRAREEAVTVELTKTEILVLLNDYADVPDYLEAERAVHAKLRAAAGLDRPLPSWDGTIKRLLGHVEGSENE